MYFSELSGNQLRVSVDLRQTFEAYREARRNAARSASVGNPAKRHGAGILPAKTRAEALYVNGESQNQSRRTLCACRFQLERGRRFRV